MKDSKPNMDRRQLLSCLPCPFSEPGQGNTSNPEYQDPPSITDPNCFAKCRDAFLLSLDEQSLDEQNYITEEGCRYLGNNQNGGELFHALYHLDITYCGLGVVGGSGQDPNFDSIRANCSSKSVNLSDPGWPSSSYQCSICTWFSQDADQSTTFSIDGIATTILPPTSFAAPTATSHGSSGSMITSSPASPASSFSADSTSTSDDALSSGTMNQFPTQGIVAIAVCSALAIASAILLLLCVLRRRRKQQEAYSGGMKSRISRVTNDFTIPPIDSYQPLISPSHSMTNERPPLTPPLPLRDRKLLPSLLRPSSRTESIPFGPSFETTHHSSSSLYSTTHSHGAKHDGLLATAPGGRSSFPGASVCEPMVGKMEPRQEWTQTHPSQGAAAPPTTTSPTPAEPSSPPYTRLQSPPPVSFTFPPQKSLDDDDNKTSPRKPGHRRGGASPSGERSLGLYPSASTSASSGYNLPPPSPRPPPPHGYRNHSTSTAGTAPANPFAPTTPPSSPVRPRRPHDEPLEIPDLVSPASPAPTSPPPTFRALPRRPPPPPPPPPPAAPVSPLLSERASAVSSLSSAGIGVARTTGAVVVGALRGPQAGGSISLRDLAGGRQRQQQQQHREGDGSRRDSWGSWEETTPTGRMFGVSFPPPAPASGTLP